MRKRTTQLSVSLAALAFSSMASPVFSGEPLRGSFTVTIVNPKTHNDGQLIQHISCPPEKFVKTGIAGGNGTDTNTTHVNNYGTISMASKVEPNLKDWIDRVKDQYEGSRAGTKPNGAVELSDRVHYGDGDAVDHHNSPAQSWHSLCDFTGVRKDAARFQLKDDGTGQQINDGGEVEGSDRRVLSPGSDPILRKRPGRGNGDGKLNDAEKKSSGSSAGRCTSPGVCSGELGHIYGCGYIGPQYPAKGQAPAVDHNSSRSNNGIVGGGGGTDMDVLGRRWRGDANRDGVVTGTDLIVVQQNFGLSVALDGPLDGDANNDGQVTGMDLIEVQQNFGQVTGNAIVGSGLSNGVIVDDNHFIGPLGGDGVFSVHNNTFGQVESTDAAVVAAVPEPATIALISAGLLFMRKTRRTR